MDYPVSIVPEPEYLGRHGVDHAFGYTIHITNESDAAITLVNRHWIITHGDGTRQEVLGEGVIGETPHLEPGKSFSYSSGAVIPTPVGSMQGSYGFSTDGGKEFRAEIPEFALHAPDSLN